MSEHNSLSVASNNKSGPFGSNSAFNGSLVVVSKCYFSQKEQRIELCSRKVESPCFLVVQLHFKTVKKKKPELLFL